MTAQDLARQRLVFALDVSSREAALSIADELAGTLSWIKVATTLYTTTGPELVRELLDRNFRVFLDLKFHDIPAQVEGACASAASLGVELMTVHATGCTAMLQAAARGAAAGSAGRQGPPSKVLAVTVLTSLDQADLNDLAVTRPVEDQVVALARLAQGAGCDGVVASPMELPILRHHLPESFGILTPGIRPAGSAAGDQKRVTTPADAVRGGADWLVVGRPIRQAPDRAAAARAILAEMAEALGA